MVFFQLEVMFSSKPDQGFSLRVHPHQAQLPCTAPKHPPWSPTGLHLYSSRHQQPWAQVPLVYTSSLRNKIIISDWMNENQQLSLWGFQGFSRARSCRMKNTKYKITLPNIKYTESRKHESNQFIFQSCATKCAAWLPLAKGQAKGLCGVWSL